MSGLLFGSNSYLFVNGVKIYQFKAKDFKLIAYLVWLGNISKSFSVYYMKQTGLNEYVYDFSVDYGSIDTDDILDMHECLMKKNNIKKSLGLLKKCLLNY